MKDSIRLLTASEQKLFERFIKYDEENLSSITKNILLSYSDDVFISQIFAIIAEDVVEVLSLNEWNEASYRKIIFTANQIAETTGCFFTASDHFLFALPIVWIYFFCEHKKYGHINSIGPKPKTLISDCKTLEYSISAQFFNFFAGPAKGKRKLFEDYKLSCHILQDL